MKTLNALGSGVAGACSLNILHETARKTVPNAPHVDQIAIRALGKSLRRIGVNPPPVGSLRKWALAGDLLANSLYYSAIAGFSERPDRAAVWRRAWILGLAAGVGAVVLPPLMGLGQQPSRKPPVTAAMTVAWYLAGALITARIYTQTRTELARSAA